MYLFSNVAVLALKSHRLLMVASLAAKLFPHATYHIVASVPESASRPIPSTLYRKVMEEIAEDSLMGVEMCLHKANVLAIRKVLLKGRPEKVILQYLREKRIDLAVMTAGVTDAHSFQLSGAVSRTMIAEAPSDLLIYPSAAKEIPEEMKTLLIIVCEGVLQQRGFAEKVVKHITKVEGFDRAIVLCRVSEGRCREGLSILKEMINDVDVNYVLKDEEFFKAYGELASEADFVIAGRSTPEFSGVKVKGKVIGKRKPSPYQLALLELSRSPILLL